MKQHEEHGGLQSAACGLLWKLAFTDTPTRQLVVKEGGVHRILFILGQRAEAGEAFGRHRVDGEKMGHGCISLGPLPD